MIEQRFESGASKNLDYPRRGRLTVDRVTHHTQVWIGLTISRLLKPRRGRDRPLCHRLVAHAAHIMSARFTLWADDTIGVVIAIPA